MHWNQVDLWTGATFVVLSGTVAFVLIQLERLRRDPTRGKLLQAAQEGQSGSALKEALSHLLPVSQQQMSALQRELIQAGLYHRGAMKEFLVLRNGLVAIFLLAPLAAGAALAQQDRQLAQAVVLTGVVLAGLGWAVPRLILRAQARARALRIAQAVPDTLDMMSMCLVGGLSLRQTLVRVGQELHAAHPDVAVELVILRHQAELLGLDRAFRALAQRTQVAEMQSLANLIEQGQQLGTNIADAIAQFADSLRLRRRQNAELQSGRASVKLLFPLVFCLLPAAAIFLWGPAVVEMVRFLGQVQPEVPAQAQQINNPRQLPSPDN